MSFKLKNENELFKIYEYEGEEIKVDLKSRTIYTNQDYFMKIPHIMEDGAICLYGNENLKINSILNEFDIEFTLTYIDYLFKMPYEVKILEFLNEFYFYLDYANRKGNFNYNIVKETVTGTTEVLNIDSLSDYFHFIDYLLSDKCHKKRYSIFCDSRKVLKISKSNKGIFVDYDIHSKAIERVDKSSLKIYSGKSVGFIGFGSVNSYILKEILLQSPSNIILQDGAKFKKGNMFRHAFFRFDKYKVISAKNVIEAVFEDEILVKSYPKKFESISDYKHFENCDVIFISVDNFVAFSEIISIIMESGYKNEIVLVGIDGFGNYGKFISIKDITVDLTFDIFKEFMTFVDEESTRMPMVTGGCGASTAIYEELDLIKLAKETVLRKEPSVKIIKFSK